MNKSIIEHVEVKEFKSVGIRLVTYNDKARGGRIDLFVISNPAEAIGEAHYAHQENAIAAFNEMADNAEAINWFYEKM